MSSSTETDAYTHSTLAWLVLFTAAALFFLSLWIVIPAPTMTLLPLGVGAPEISPLLLVGALLTAVLAWKVRGQTQYISLALAVIASGLFIFPIAQYPGGVPLSLQTLALGVETGEPRIARGIRFAEAGGVPLTVDIYRPASDTTSAPIVVQIYGGAWQRGAPGDDAVFASHLASRGYVVFAIDYRHAPAWKWPTQLDDVRTALAWVRARAKEYGADASKIALFGRSAGAQLAMVTGLQDPGVRAVVSYYGPVNLTQGWREPPRPDPIGSRSTLETYIGGTPDQMPERYREASPISYVSAKAPRTLLIYGTRDHVVQVRFGRQLRDALRAAGASSELIEIPWAEHAFDAIPGGLSGQVALFHTEQFLADVFR